MNIDLTISSAISIMDIVAVILLLFQSQGHYGQTRLLQWRYVNYKAWIRLRPDSYSRWMP